MNDYKGQNGYHLIQIAPHSALEVAGQWAYAAGQSGVRQFPYSATLIRGHNAKPAIIKLARSFYHKHNSRWKSINNKALGTKL
ncbi:hypothetical protein F4679DRAFT_374371 [Xylaria curta]|nr:hypothetical protein F4679DRAFT_374371 [Xylaria curta]